MITTVSSPEAEQIWHATTAAVVDQTTIDAEADNCPMLVYFDEGESTTTQYASVDDDAFLLPHATT